MSDETTGGATRAATARLVDVPGQVGRTTASLLAALAARLAMLYVVSGADAIGSLTAGFAALGRRVAATTEGARLLEAIEAGRPGMNGERLWSTLRIGEWASSMPPSPVLDQLHNDLALLLANDLEDALELPPLPPEPNGPGAEAQASADGASFAHCALGMWAFGRELAEAVEAIAAPTLSPANRVLPAPAAPASGEAAGSSVLR